MSQDEVAGLILDGLYELKEDDSEIPSLVEIAESRGVTSRSTIGRASDYLAELGFLDNYLESGRDYAGQLSAKAARLYEQHGSGKAVMDFVHRPSPELGGVHFHGPVDRSAIAVHSTQVRQSVAISEPSQLAGLVDSLAAAIRADRTLAAASQAEALDVAEALKTEIEKERPSSGVLKALLSTLAPLAVAADYVQRIREALGI